MPEVALETKKRRLNKLLDNWSETSLQATSTDTPTSLTRPPANATEAFDLARQRATKRLRRSNSSSSFPGNVVLFGKSTPAVNGKDGDKPGPPPNYSPWSHETFLARLRTFSSVSQWHPKPEAISEVEWVKRGWSCVDVNTVACRGGCEKRVVVSLGRSASVKDIAEASNGNINGEEGDDDDDEEDGSTLEQALVDRYSDLIISGHSLNCLWRKAGCKPDIYRLQVIRPSAWQPELRTRFRSICNIRQSVAEVRLPRWESDGKVTLSAERLLHDLPASVLGEETNGQENSSDGERPQVLNLALHGWRGSTESGSSLLHCDACFQRIGLWMYQPDYRPTTQSHHDDNDDATNGEEEADTTTLAILDPTELHREHCPWRNAATQQALGTLRELNASQVLLRVVSTCARDQRRRTDERGKNTGSGELDGTRQELALEEEEESGQGRVRTSHAKEEIAKQDRERESRLRKLKSLFSIKRRPTTKVVEKAAGR